MSHPLLHTHCLSSHCLQVVDVAAGVGIVADAVADVEVVSDVADVLVVAQTLLLLQLDGLLCFFRLYSSDLFEDYDDEDEDMDIKYVRKYKKPKHSYIRGHAEDFAANSYGEES